MIAGRHVAGLVVVALAAAPAPARAGEADLGARLIASYGTPAGYRAVRREVLAWHGTTRNGCAAFASTALRRVGVAVPQHGKRDGWSVSRITFALSDHLEHVLGWRRVTAAAELSPGDLVFTTGYPDHVFVFAAWRDRRRAVATAIDNLGPAHARPLFPPAGSEVSAFAYALRAPAGG